MLLCVQTSECRPTVNGAGSTLHVPLFSLQAAEVTERGSNHVAMVPKGLALNKFYPCHLNIHALFQHPTISYV